MRLWLHLTLNVVGIIFAAFLGYGMYVAWEQTENLKVDIQRNTLAIAQSVAAAAANDLLGGDYDKLESLLRQNVAIDRISDLVIADAAGRVIAQVARDPGGKPRAVYGLVAKPLLLDPQEILTDEHYSYLLAIERGERIGWVRVTSSLAEVDALQRRIRMNSLLFSSALSLLAGLVMLLVARRIGGMIEQAAEFADRLVDHGGAHLEIGSRIKEVSQIQTALNKASALLKQQFQVLQDSEARKSAVLAASLDALITIDTDGRIVDLNPAAEATFGYRREEAIGAVMGDLIVPPVHRQAHAQGMRHYLATGIGPALHRRIEISALRRDGSEFPVELSIAPFESGGEKYFLGSLRDISERKALEAEQVRINGLLKQSVRELEYQKLALDQHSIVSITDAEGRITYVNDKFSEISGYGKDELLGRTHRIVKSGLHSPEFYQDLWQSIATGKVWHGQIVNRKKTGELYWVAATIVPWLDDAGLPYQYVAIRTDITAQKRIEHDLADARRRELETGSEIQRSLLLGDFPEGIHGARLATYTESSQGIDGDFFAVTRFRPDCFELLVGDVMGKGVPAALIGAGVKSSYNKVLAELFAQRADEHQLPAPAEIINALHRNLTPRLIELSSFVTLALYRFDIAAGTLCVVNAGHTPGLLARSADGSIQQVMGDNLPIGVIEDEVYLQQSLALAPGDAVLVYSDGITESFNGQREEFGLARLCSILGAGRAVSLPPSSLLQSMRQQVRDFVGSEILDDDQTAIMVEVLPGRISPRRGIEQRVDPDLLILPWRLDGLGALRARIAETAGHLAEDEVQALILASFEAATNILRHAEPYFSDATIACRLTRRPDEYSVELIYPGPDFSPPVDPQPDFSGNSDGGFGLYIINNCVDAVEYASPLPGVSSIRLIKRAARERGAATSS
jgi:PAS domain S-box-containing protein